jgi:serine-type D-Ala-D-Ala carboxypeptidase (penicillin-binding protein 5/6)
VSSHYARRAIVRVSVFLVLLSASFLAAEDRPSAPHARCAILIDQATGTVLYESNADAPQIPASLTKMMTLHLAWCRIEEGLMKRDDPVVISKRAWSRSQASGSSLMFLEPGQLVTVGELMRGIAVVSGNDAAVALAEHIGGSVESFVSLMNEEARRLGFRSMKFSDPAGIEADNTVTAREFASFCRLYIERHPTALKELHSVREMIYPLPQNIPEGSPRSAQPIRQSSQNTLLGNELGVDGLKTGHLDARNYTGAFTAERDGMRLITVLLGIEGSTGTLGKKNRDDDATALLAYGFRTYATVHPAVPRLPVVRIWKGAVNEVTLTMAGSPVITDRRDAVAHIVSEVTAEPAVMAPVKRGAKLGEVVYKADGRVLGRFDIVAASDVKQAGFLKSAIHSLRIAVRSLFGKGL